MPNYMLDKPFLVFAISFALQWIAAFVGDRLRTWVRATQHADRDDFATILPAALTLLALIVGFTFSMAISRYDLRKNYEEAEANAIGTEYVRADLLPPAQTSSLRALLAKYTTKRILFYEERDDARLEEVNADTAALQTALWSATTGPALAQPTPVWSRWSSRA